MREDVILSEFKALIGTTVVTDKDVFYSVLYILDILDEKEVKINDYGIELLVGELENMKSENEDFNFGEEEKDIVDFIDMHGTIGSVYHRNYEELQALMETLNADENVYKVVSGDIGVKFTQSALLDSDIFTDISFAELWPPLYDMNNVPTELIEGDVWNAVMDIIFMQLAHGNTFTIGRYSITKVD